MFAELAPIGVPSIAPESMSTLDIFTSPLPFGVRSILPSVSVDVIALPSTFILSTCIAPLLIFNADVVPSPSSIDLSVPSTPLVSILSNSG